MGSVFFRDKPFEFSAFNFGSIAASALCLTFILPKQYQSKAVLESISPNKFFDLISGIQNLAQMILKVSSNDYEFKVTLKKFRKSKL